MKTSTGFILSATLTAALLAGCNGSSSTTPPGTGTNCGNPPPGFQILYPRNNAKRVDPNIGGVYVAAKPALASGNSYNFLAIQSSGGQQFTSPFATYSGSIPTPHNTPAAGATVYVTYFQYPIGPLQSVQLAWNDGGTGCNPNVVVSQFSTGQ
jgi:hypothetical protein